MRQTLIFSALAIVASSLVISCSLPGTGETEATRPSPTLTTEPYTMSVEQVPTATLQQAAQTSGFTLNGTQARQIATLMDFVDAYNAGDHVEALALFDDENILLSACDYEVQTGQVFRSQEAIANWLIDRAADHDQLAAGEIFNHNPNPLTGGRILGVTFAQQSSDTLTALGFPNGIVPGTGTVSFNGAGDRIVSFAIGPGSATPAEQEACDPARTE